MDVPWRLGEDLTVPTPHHITSGRCPASHCGHQEPFLITAAADSTLSGHPRTRLQPHSLKEIMNERRSHLVPLLMTQRQHFHFKQHSRTLCECMDVSQRVTLTDCVPLGKPPFLKVSAFARLDRKGCQTRSQAAQQGHPGESSTAPSETTS